MSFKKTLHIGHLASGEQVRFIFSREDGVESIIVLDADDTIMFHVTDFEAAYRAYEDEVRR